MAAPWTISKYQQWMSCGLFYALEHRAADVIGRFPGWDIERLPERQSSPAMDRGNRVHKACEELLQGKLVTPVALFDINRDWDAQLELLADAMEKAADAGTEVLWGYDREWYPARRDVWHRQKLDAWMVYGEDGTVIDFKTGGIYPDKHAEAMEVYALGMFAQFDDLQTVTSELWYLDHPIGAVTTRYTNADNPTKRTFKREETKELASRWERRAIRFQEDEEFNAKPGRPQCLFCPYHAKKGGPCTKGI